MAARPWLGSAQRRCSRACPCAPVFPAPRRRVLPAMEFAGSHPVVLVSDARSGHGRYRAFPCPVLAWLPARQCALLARLALIPIASSFLVASCVQLYIRHPHVSSSSPSNLVLPCSTSSNPESRSNPESQTLGKNKRGPCASLIKCSVKDFNRRSSSFRASSRNLKSWVKTNLAA
jgi:hypothetical protein